MTHQERKEQRAMFIVGLVITAVMVYVIGWGV
jgi:cell division protein FtsB